MFAKLKSIFSTKPNQPLHKVEGYSLYEFPTCPFCFKVRRALIRMGLDIELRNIHKSQQYATELITHGGRRMVPCLKIESKEGVFWMYESDDIIAHLKAKFTDN